MNKRCEDQLKVIIGKNLRAGISIEEINDDSDLINDFFFDSIQILRLIHDIEKEFDLIIENENLIIETLTNFGNLKNYIAGKVFAYDENN